MTQVPVDGDMVPVTLVKAEPNQVVKLTDPEKEQVFGIVLGYGEKKNPNKPEQGKFDGKVPKMMTQFQLTEDKHEEFQDAEVIDVDIFEEGDLVKVSGVSKGKGFAGGIKRHNFSSRPKSHGHKDVRQPGSAGPTGRLNVMKGKKMPGRLGGEKTTIQNLEVIGSDPESNQLLIKGALPGPENNHVVIEKVDYGEE